MAKIQDNRPIESGAMPTEQVTTAITEIKLAHSPDSDDAFMFYGLATHRVKSPGLKFTHVLSDIETLNQSADNEVYDVTAISFSAYAYLRHKYVLLDCGASFGEGYGPIVVSSKPMKRSDLVGARVAVPGLRTTAYLTLRLYEPNFQPVPIAFDQIFDAVRARDGRRGITDSRGATDISRDGPAPRSGPGHWWLEKTKLPLPLGGNAVRRALGPEMGRKIAKAIRDSVAYGLDHREEALNYAMEFARDMDPLLADKFVGMYVNRWTLGYGERGRAAVQELLNQGCQAGLIPGPATAEFLD